MERGWSVSNSKTIDKYKGVERKRYPHLGAKRGFIFYRSQNKNPAEIKESLINDITANKLSFDTPDLVKSGVNLECEIYQPLDQRRNIIVPISILAKVVWSREIANSDDFGSNKYSIVLRFIKGSLRRGQKK